MTLNEVYEYLKMNGLPVTFHDDNTRIRLEGSTAALDTVVFLKVYKRSDEPYCAVASNPFVWLAEATYRDLDKLVESYIDHCDHDRAKRIRVSRLRYAVDLHQRQTVYRQTQTV
jgi:hypothetical protein